MPPLRSAASRLLGAVCCATVFLAVAADASAFQGRVRDPVSGRPIAGAQIGIAGIAGTVPTDADGRFSWSPDPRPPFVLLILLPGGRLAKPVRVTTSPDAPLTIDAEPAVDETLVVTGGAPSVDAPPGASTTIISSTDIDRRASANLTQALENVVGVSAVAEGQSAVPAVRGLARGRTLLLLDGGRLFAERRAGPSVTAFSPDTLDRIEVVRGPASVAYGSDAFGGVISMITPQPAVGAPPAAQVTLTGGAGVPSWRADGSFASGLGTHAGVHASARHRETRDYDSAVARVSNSAWEDGGALVRVAGRAGGWWAGSWQHDDAGPVGLPRSDSATLLVSNPYERSRRGTATFDRSGIRGVDNVSASAVFGRYAQRLDQDRVAAPGRPRRIDRADIDGDTMQIRAITRTALGASHVTAGMDVNGIRDMSAHDIAIVYNAAGDVTSTTDTPSMVSADRTDAAGFAQIDAPVAAALSLTAGVRYDHVRSVNTGGFFGDRAVSHDDWSGSAGAHVRASTQWSIGAQVSRGFHDPTLSDRFYRGPVGRGFIVGNPDLLPETSLQMDVTSRYERARWWIAASVYRYDIHDLIERYQATADTFLFRNRGLARVRGVELQFHATLGAGVVMELAGQTGRGRADDGAALDDIAPHSVLLLIRKPFGSAVMVSGRVATVGHDAAPGPSEVATTGYVEAGVNASWRARRWLEWRMTASNLLNQEYFSSPSPRGVLAPGRAATLSVVLSR